MLPVAHCNSSWKFAKIDSVSSRGATSTLIEAKNVGCADEKRGPRVIELCAIPHIEGPECACDVAAPMLECNHLTSARPHPSNAGMA